MIGAVRRLVRKNDRPSRGICLRLYLRSRLDDGKILDLCGPICNSGDLRLGQLVIRIIILDLSLKSLRVCLHGSLSCCH